MDMQLRRMIAPVSGRLQLIKRSSFATVPWKNGGGITHEALRVPAAGAAFDWRVSLAQIDQSGPFSDFSGYRRAMVLLQGRGVRLRFATGLEHALRQVGDLIEFDGGTPAECDLIDGPCLDLNLMTANALPVTAQVLNLQDPLEITAAASACCLIMSLLAPLQLQPAGASVAYLGALDLAVYAGPGSLVLSPPEPHSGTPLPTFFATISHGRQS
jgi:uncharacterized protein